MPLSAGTRLGPYEIVSPIGAGGMGEVYRAHDPRMGRDVAIKLCAERFSDRFEREVRAVAALNHPNICQVYDVGPNYLVMELVDGSTLSEQIETVAMPLDEALAIARQIAEALEAAHEKGIIHRDLKPANVKVTPEGKVKVLDFGLAKAVETPSVGQPDFSQSPTITAEGTEIGTVLGTAAYMSPEQARGRPVDKRADIWAFGCVLYECLARRRAFAGMTNSDCMAAVLASEPDWKLLPDHTPAGIRALLRRCLEKDPRRRLRDIGDAGIEIAEALARPARTAMPEVPMARSKSRIFAVAAASFLAGALTVSLSMHSKRDSAAARTVARFAIPLSEEDALKPTNSPNVAISADGGRLALAGVRANSPTGQIFIRGIDQEEAKPSTDAMGGVPFFSPDGKWIAFYEGGRQIIRKAALSGGAPITLATSPGIAGGSWGEDGNIVWSFFDELLSVSSAGGPAKTLLKADLKNGERFYRQPWYLPGAKGILFTVGRENMQTFNDAQIAVLSLETRQKKILVDGGMCPRYSPTGHLVYARAGSLLAVPFDLKKLAVSGQPFRVADGVFMSIRTGMAAFAISAKGDLVYAKGPIDTGDRQPFWVDRKGAATPLPLPPRPYLHPRLAPDDRQLAIEIEGAAHDSYFYDISRGALTQFSFDGSTHWPLWSSRGDRITFRSGRTTPMSMWWMPADRSGEDERLGSIDGQMQNPESWSPDGRALLFTQKRKDAGSDILVLEMDRDHRPRPLVQTKFDEGAPKFSPDGKWVSYCSNESGRTEVYVTPYPGPGARIQVSTDGGTDAVWRRKGGELYYREGDTMMVVSVTTEPKLTLSKPRALWKGKYTEGTSTMCGEPGATSTNYDVTADGERFLMIQEKTENAVARQVSVVLGWAEELKRTAQTRN
jgi:eukaryotic-like serine/threonine-protein kinase